jgi:polyhydroxyalkanoate synthesis regulator phasin
MSKRAPLWRQTFDAVERPIASVSESWVQTDTFMDLLAVSFRAQRRVGSTVERGLQAWVAAWGMPTRGDVTALVNQVASLERKVRELERELQERG